MDIIQRIVIVPGNGCTSTGRLFHSNWYGWLYSELNKWMNAHRSINNTASPAIFNEATQKWAYCHACLRFDYPAIVNEARKRESVWLPFMHDELKCDENTIIVGHSSGAEAAMRYAEKYKVKGIVMVSPCVRDRGKSIETASGYYNHPWLWEKMKENTQFIVVFGSRDDSFIPWSEMQQVIDNLQPECHQYDDKGHFHQSQMPDILEAVTKHLK